MTEFDKQCEILAELWIAYRNDESLADFFAYNDIGMPIAYCITEDLVVANARTEEIVKETWDMLIEALEVKDTGYATLEELLTKAK